MSAVRPWLVVWVAALGATGCGESSETGEGQGGQAPTVGCLPGEQPLDDGSCLPAGDGAGIPPELCGEGFAPDDTGGCVAILPPAPCPPGQMAVPGEDTCRAVAPCGEAPWGDIPLEPNSQHVDGSYAGGNSDGTADRPWATIQEAVTAAEAGAIVAVAAGAYTGPIDFEQKTVRLWGRCPDLVEVSAPSGDVVTLSGDGSEVHTLAVTGGLTGVRVVGQGALVDRLWIQGGGQAGMQLLSTGTVQGTLIEQGPAHGVFVSGATATMTDSVIRGYQHRGISIENSGATPAVVTLEALVFEQNHESALWVQGSDVTVERCVMRDTQMGGAGYRSGSGIYAQFSTSLGAPANVTVNQSVFERNSFIGIDVWGANLTMQASVVRDTQPDEQGQNGRGFEIGNELTIGQVSNVAIESCVVERNLSVGILGNGAQVTVDGTIVRDTLLNDQDVQSGKGVVIQRSSTEAEPSSLTVRGSLIERNQVSGVFASGANVTVETTLIRDTIEELATGLLGRGISVTGQAANDPVRTTALVRYSALERNHEVGVFAGGSVDLVLEASRISDTLPDASLALGGWGATAQEMAVVGGRASMLVVGCLIERCRTHGLAALGADMDVIDTVVRDTAAREYDGLAGDAVVYAVFDSLAVGLVSGCVLENNARVGIGNWGATVATQSSRLDCNPIDLNGEAHLGYDYSFEDLGGNVCGCGSEQRECAVLSAELAPPDPLQ